MPPRVEYALTDKGQALLPLIEDMRSYGREWLGCRADEAAKREQAGEREPAIAAL